jgi:hypothetical protein
VGVIDPRARRVYVHRSLTDVHELTEGERLDVPVARLFEE